MGVTDRSALQDIGPGPAAGGHWRRVQTAPGCPGGRPGAGSRPPRGVLGPVQAPARSGSVDGRGQLGPATAPTWPLRSAGAGELSPLPRRGPCLSLAPCGHRLSGGVMSRSHESGPFRSQTKCFLGLHFLPKIRIPCSGVKVWVAGAPLSRCSPARCSSGSSRRPEARAQGDAGPCPRNPEH